MPRDPRDSRKWREFRKTILARDGYVCFYCGQNADTVDHVEPIVKSPDLAFSPDNCVSACRKCNGAKGSRSQGVFLRRTFAPPAFRDVLSPMQSEILQDSPFKL